jgi:predicted phosphoribosyltransferase
VALDDGGAIVGAEIAQQLGVPISMLVSEEIYLPLEPLAVGGMAPDGQFVYNPQYSQADIQDLEEENRGYIEAQKINKYRDINQIISSHGVIDRKTLTGQNIILVSDGLPNTFKLDVALSFLKTVNYQRLIVATPLAAVSVVDWMHIHADEICCLSVLEDYSDTNHYYDVQDVPDHDTLMSALNTKLITTAS